MKEDGGLEVIIHDNLTSMEAAFEVQEANANPTIVKALQQKALDYAKQVESDGSIIEEGAVVKNCLQLMDVHIGPKAHVIGATRLVDVSINSLLDAPSGVGANVIMEHVIVGSDSHVTDAAQLDNCFVGQGCHIGRLYSATQSLFFANCHFENGEACIAVCESRVRGVKQLQRQVEHLDVVVLDDALQHRALRCGLNILLTPYDHLYIDDHMLPWGTLRDLPHRALAADAIVVTKCPDTIRPIDMRVVDNRLHLPTYQLLHFAGLNYAPMEQEGTPLVLCGIAQPQYMMEYVLAHYPKAQLMAYPDHHRYSPKDIEEIMQRAADFDFVLFQLKQVPFN